MANFLQDVATYNKANLAFLLNSYAFINLSNKKFERFNDDIPKQLGSKVTFDLPPRFTTKNSLVASFEGAVQRVQELTVDKQVSTSYEFTAQEFIFNDRDYMERFGKAAVCEIGSEIESDVSELAESNTFRFFGNGTKQVENYKDLANMLAFFRNFGAAKDNTRCVLSDITYPSIVNSGLNQFVPLRNDKMANSWEVGRFRDCEWYESNLLKTHTAGSAGEQSSPLTVVSTVLNPNNGVTEIIFSGAPSNDPNAVKKYDKFQFADNVGGGIPNVRYLTFIGHKPSQNPVQFAAVEDSGSGSFANPALPADQVRVVLTDSSHNFPALQAAAGRDQNLTSPIIANMVANALPSHRCGLLYSGNALFLAMPKLPSEVPFPTSVITDSDSGASLRQYYGSLFGQNQRGMVHDCIWGRTLVPEYAMMVVLPV